MLLSFRNSAGSGVKFGLVTDGGVTVVMSFDLNHVEESCDLMVLCTVLYMNGLICNREENN